MINSVNPLQITTQPSPFQQKADLNTNKVSFADSLKQAVEKVNQSQIESDKMTTALAAGENVDLHNVMITAEKASVTMTLATEVRNKAIEAYQEMMRMQV